MATKIATKKNPVIEFLKENSYFVALIVLIIVAAISNSNFLKITNLMNILRQTSIVGIISLGMTFVIILGGIDLSVGPVVAICSAVIINCQLANMPLIACLLIGCVVGAAIGLLNGVIISKGNLAPFIVTLATMSIGRSLIIFFANGGTYVGKMDPILMNIGNGGIGVLSYPVIIFVVTIICAYFLLNRTKFGRYVYAIGGNEETALYSGIKVSKIKALTYGLLGLTIGIASIIETSRLVSVSSSTSGLYYELDAIAAVIIGGTAMSGGKGKLAGTVVGIIMLGVINNMMNMAGISTYLNGAVKGIIILAAVLIQRKNSN